MECQGPGCNCNSSAQRRFCWGVCGARGGEAAKQGGFLGEAHFTGGNHKDKVSEMECVAFAQFITQINEFYEKYQTGKLFVYRKCKKKKRGEKKVFKWTSRDGTRVGGCRCRGGHCWEEVGGSLLAMGVCLDLGRGEVLAVACCPPVTCVLRSMK